MGPSPDRYCGKCDVFYAFDDEHRDCERSFLDRVNDTLIEISEDAMAAMDAADAEQERRYERARAADDDLWMYLED